MRVPIQSPTRATMRMTTAHAPMTPGVKRAFIPSAYSWPMLDTMLAK